MTSPETRKDTGTAAARIYHVIRVRRRSVREWLALILWLTALLVLLEFTISSRYEREGQAAVLAGALFVGLLLAGLIVQVMRGVEATSPLRSGQIAPAQAATEDSAAPVEPDESAGAGGASISRRAFLTNIGMTGATAGVVGATGMAALGKPLGSAMAGGVHQRPWWVRQVDRPTTGIDWTVMERVNAAQDTLAATRGLGRFATPEENARLIALADENVVNRLANDMAGYTLKDLALANAFQGGSADLPRSFLGPGQAPRPQDLEVDRWQGTAQENSAMLKVAMQQMGAAMVGIVELNEQTRKLIYRVDNDGKRIEFEEVAQAYEDDEKRVIPFSARYVVVYAVQMSGLAMRRAPTKIAQMTTRETYQRGLLIQNNTQEFLRGLGYQGLGEARQNGLGISPAFAVLGGLGELSRLNRVITPEFGPMVRIFKLITDLPLQADRPIDAGIARFCRSCKKCAEACPPVALSFATNPGWEPVGEWNNPGHEAWFEDSRRCRQYWYEELGSNCGICFAVCPFSKPNRSFMHDLVRMQLAVFPELGGLLRNMDDAFGYGIQKDPETWWDLDLPEYGIDTHKD